MGFMHAGKSDYTMHASEKNQFLSKEYFCDYKILCIQFLF